MSAFPKVIYTFNEIPIISQHDFCGYWQAACKMRIGMQNTKNFQVSFEEGKEEEEKKPCKIYTTTN